EGKGRCVDGRSQVFHAAQQGSSVRKPGERVKFGALFQLELRFRAVEGPSQLDRPVAWSADVLEVVQGGRGDDRKQTIVSTACTGDGGDADNGSVSCCRVDELARRKVFWSERQADGGRESVFAFRCGELCRQVESSTRRRGAFLGNWLR